jgi:GT2 family glycosyltransferase
LHSILCNTMKKTATIILNRNLPQETNALVEHLKKFDGNNTDIFVVEAGSSKRNLSKYCTWHVETKNVINHGMRYSRGMNYGLLQLWKEEKWKKYDSFFLITNDTKFPNNQKTIESLQKILQENSKIGILSPCSEKWGEKSLIGPNSLKYFWFIHNNAYFFRKELVEEIMNIDLLSEMNFLFDGDNFRGYLSESEIIAKAYANNWAAAITTAVFSEEDETYLLDKNLLIRTETYEENTKLYIEEGLRWIKKKYGFNSRWQMMQYSQLFYDKFFDYNPQEKVHKI